ncbi:hypothetical protein ANTRET_LOCUS3245 [Anthophora retusa]
MKQLTDQSIGEHDRGACPKEAEGRGQLVARSTDEDECLFSGICRDIPSAGKKIRDRAEWEELDKAASVEVYQQTIDIDIEGIEKIEDMWRGPVLLLLLAYCGSLEARGRYNDVLSVESLRRDVRQPILFATEVEDLLSDGNTPEKQQSSKKSGKKSSGTMVDTHYVTDEDDHQSHGDEQVEATDHGSYTHEDGGRYTDHGPESSSYGHGESYADGDGEHGSYESHSSYSTSSGGEHGDEGGHYY